MYDLLVGKRRLRVKSDKKIRGKVSIKFWNLFHDLRFGKFSKQFLQMINSTSKREIDGLFQTNTYYLWLYKQHKQYTIDFHSQFTLSSKQFEQFTYSIPSVLQRLLLTQQTFISSNTSIETLKKGVRYVQS